MKNAFAAQTFFADYLRAAFVTANTVIDVFEYEPAEDQFHTSHPNGVFLYFSETNLEPGSATQQGPQQHDPIFNIDVFVSAAASNDQGVITESSVVAQKVGDAIVTFIYATILNQTTIDKAETALGININKATFRNISKIGTVKKSDTSKSVVGFRFRFMVSVQEDNAGYEGTALSSIVDSLVANQN
jgi:hypothetical protein